MQLFGIVLFAVVSAVAANKLPNDFHGVPLHSSWLSGASKLMAVANSQFAEEGKPTVDTACGAQYSCVDCNTARLCKEELNGDFTELMRVQCPPQLPYCDYVSGSCSTKTTIECSEPDNDFICSKDGYFPDTSNSSIYHVCKNLVPHKFECIDPQKSYIASVQSCCYTGHFKTFSCSESGIKTPYAKGSDYFGYCPVQNAPPAIVDKCPGISKLNETSQLCETTCDSVGIIPDSEDCSRYYRCDVISIGSFTGIAKTRKSCPAGTTFNYVDKLCIESTANKYCATDI